jgi:hypothetical protein
VVEAGAPRPVVDAHEPGLGESSAQGARHAESRGGTGTRVEARYENCVSHRRVGRFGRARPAPPLVAAPRDRPPRSHRVSAGETRAARTIAQEGSQFPNLFRDDALSGITEVRPELP